MKNIRLEQWIAPQHLRPQAVKKLAARYRSATPFPHIALDNFLHERIARELLRALIAEKFYPKKSDLFQLAQTQSLAASTQPVIQAVRSVFRSPEFTDYIARISGVKLKSGKLDFNGALYQDTDHLLCHDDELDTRKIAFMLYLNTLTKKDGGSLNLLGTKNKKPHRVVKKLWPKFNTLTFFTVSEKSFHEVEEVVSQAQRLNVGGWLHG